VQNYLLIFLFLFIFSHAMPASSANDCVLVALKAEREVFEHQIKNSAKAQEFKDAWQGRSLDLDNREFMRKMESGQTVGVDMVEMGGPIADAEYGDYKSLRFRVIEKKDGVERLVYVDIENAVLKDLNDKLFKDKKFGDAVNNMYYDAFYNELKQQLASNGKEYDLNQLLKATYQQANQKLLNTLESTGLLQLALGMEGQLGKPAQWFLGGIGSDAIKANMGARGARQHLKDTNDGLILDFADHLPQMHQDILAIKKVHESLQNNRELLRTGIMTFVEDGKYILDYDVVEILRKNKRGSFPSTAEYRAAIRAKIKSIYAGAELADDKVIDAMTDYFEKCDAINPPLFIRDRIRIDLEKAQHGIVSIDFSGMGVENIQAIMKGMLETEANVSPNVVVDRSLGAIWREVQKVTDNFNLQKRELNQSLQNFGATTSEGANPVRFSGDDGIFLPDRKWSSEEKKKLISIMSKKNPSKYRLVFVDTNYVDGSVIPAKVRSELIVKSENLEKELRKAVVGLGVDKISKEQAKELMICIDYIPIKEGKGTFHINLGGKVDNAIEEKIKKVLANDGLIPAGHSWDMPRR